MPPSPFKNCGIGPPSLSEISGFDRVRVGYFLKTPLLETTFPGVKIHTQFCLKFRHHFFK